MKRMLCIKCFQLIFNAHDVAGTWPQLVKALNYIFLHHTEATRSLTERDCAYLAERILGHPLTHHDPQQPISFFQFTKVSGQSECSRAETTVN